MEVDPRVLRGLQQGNLSDLQRQMFESYLKKIELQNDPEVIAGERLNQEGVKDLAIIGQAARGFDEAASKAGGTRPSASLGKMATELRADSRASSPAGVGGIDPRVFKHLAQKKEKPRTLEITDDKGDTWQHFLDSSGRPTEAGKIKIKSTKYKRDQDATDRSQKNAKAYSVHPYVKGSEAIRDKYNETLRLMTKEPTGPQDIAIIISFMKTLDPGSVVREGEFKTAAEAGGLIEKLTAAKNKVVGEGLVSEKTRQDILSAMQEIYNSRMKSQNSFDSRFEQDFGYKPRPDQWQVKSSEAAQPKKTYILQGPNGQMGKLKSPEKLQEKINQGYKLIGVE